MKSMTAFGRGVAHSEKGHVVFELSSLNRKFLEVTTLLPSEFESLEAEIRSTISQRIERGAIKVKLMVAYTSGSPVTVRPNTYLAAQIKQACDLLAQVLHLGDARVMTQEILANRHDVLQFEASFEDQELFKQLASNALEDALKELMQMKLVEGNALKEDVAKRLEIIKASFAQIALQSTHATDDYRQKLIARLEELVPGSVENEERVLREVVLFAEKVDIAEELTRADSHLSQLEALIHSNEPSIGKTFEFLLQELLREANTIGSKSSSAAISHHIVSIKSEIERLKEQIRNVE